MSSSLKRPKQEVCGRQDTALQVSYYQMLAAQNHARCRPTTVLGESSGARRETLAARLQARPRSTTTGELLFEAADGPPADAVDYDPDLPFLDDDPAACGPQNRRSSHRPCMGTVWQSHTFLALNCPIWPAFLRLTALLEPGTLTPTAGWRC
jgi:hypothetical protein